MRSSGFCATQSRVAVHLPIPPLTANLLHLASSEASIASCGVSSVVIYRLWGMKWGALLTVQGFQVNKASPVSRPLWRVRMLSRTSLRAPLRALGEERGSVSRGGEGGKKVNP